MLVVNDEEIKPLPVLTGKAEMPARARERLDELGATLILRANSHAAQEQRNARTSCCSVRSP